MANTLRFKRGLASGLPTGVAGEPLFTTDTFDLYIGTSGGNQRFQKYIASGTTLQYLRGDGTLATFPVNPITGTGTTNYLPKFTGASALGDSNLINDASGNLGLGVVPSAWNTTYSVMQIGSGGSIVGYKTSNANELFIGANVLENTSGTWTYLTSASASQYLQINGSHFWRNAPSGSANAAITWTTAMTLDASGNLAVGTTTTTYKFDVQTTGQTIANLSSSFASGGYVSIGRTGAVSIFGSFASASGGGTQINADALFFRNTTGIAFSGSGATPRLWLTTADNLVIGSTTDTTEKLQVNGTMKVTGASTFGGDINLSNASNTGKIYINGGQSSARQYLIQNAITGVSNSGFEIRDVTGSFTPFSIASTGAATFSSSVTATRYLVTPSGSSLVYNFVNSDNTYTGAYVFQAGGGSAGFGGAIVAYGHSHATKAGWITAGISAGSGGKFSVNASALGDSTDVFTVDASGAGVFNSSVTAARATLTSANNTATGGGQIYLNGATGNRIDFSLAGVGLPTFTTRSVGTKIVLRPEISASFVDYAIGINSNTLWFSVPDNASHTFAWYGGTTAQMQLVNGSLGVGMSPSYKLDVTGEARVSSAIAIGTTPDTNKPFKILKNINATVGINFENTSTSSLAFSAIQMGTDVTGGTAFTNLVYGSSGITQTGVYHPNGTSLINNGGGGLNFLGTPTRFYTGGSNGVLRLLFDNEGTTQFTATTPTTNATDGYKQYSADVVAGNAAPHFRTENGGIIKLYQETTGVGNAIFSQGGGTGVLDDSTFDGYTLRQIVKALRNQGILA